MKYQIYTTSKKAWDAMIEAIDEAQKSIYIEMYIFLDDTAKSHDFIGKLKKKAREGLKVAIVADALEAINCPRKQLKKSKNQVLNLFFSATG